MSLPTCWRSIIDDCFSAELRTPCTIRQCFNPALAQRVSPSSTFRIFTYVFRPRESSSSEESSCCDPSVLLRALFCPSTRPFRRVSHFMRQQIIAHIRAISSRRWSQACASYRASSSASQNDTMQFYCTTLVDMRPHGAAAAINVVCCASLCVAQPSMLTGNGGDVSGWGPMSGGRPGHLNGGQSKRAALTWAGMHEEKI